MLANLRQASSDKKLDPEVRIANWKGLIARAEKEDDLLLLKLSKDENEWLRAASFGHLLDRGLDPSSALSLKATKSGTLPVCAILADCDQDSAKVISIFGGMETSETRAMA